MLKNSSHLLIKTFKLMRKNFLLLLWLTLLPLAGWAQHLDFEEDTYSGSSLSFPTVWYDNYETQAITTSGFTSGNSQYRITNWTYEGNNVTQYKDAGEYTVIVQRRTRPNSWSTWGSWGTYRTLTFTVNKVDVTVSLFQVVREWKAPWENPDVATLENTAYTVTGADATWDLVKGSLTWNQLQVVENVGSYKYTMNAGEHKNYVIHVDAGAADLKVEKNTTSYWKTTATDGADLTYSGEEQTLAPTDVPEFMDTDDNVAGTIEYSLDGTTWSEEYPKGKDADTYTVQYRGVGDINHIDAATVKTYTVKINKYELVESTDFTAPTAVVGTEYDEAPHAIAAAGGFIGKFAAELEAAGAKFQYDGADALPEQTAVGTYNFDWDIDLGTSTNFTYSVGATTVTGATIVTTDITDADVTAPVGKTGLEYILDTDQVLIDAAVVADDSYTSLPKGTVWYSVDGGSWVDNIANVVGQHVKANGEKYEISWYVEGDANHNDYGSATSPAGTVEVAIAPVQFVLKADAIPATDLVYNADPQKLLKESVKGGAPNMPQGSTTWKLNGTELAAGSTYEDVKGTDAGTYTISYTVVPKEAKYENDYLPYTPADDIKVFIDQYTLYIGAKPLSGKVEDFFDLEDNNKPLFTMFDFLKDGAFLKDVKDDKDAQKAILNKLIVPTPKMEEIFASAKVGGNVITLNKVDINPDEEAMNYKVDAATLLSEEASLNITATEAAIQADPVAATLEYNGADQELVATAAEGYKANGGAGTVAIGKVVYSLEKEGTYTDDLTTIVGKDADDYKVYYKVELSTEKTSIDRFYEYTAEVKELPVTIAQKPLDIAMFTFSDDDMKAEFTGDDLMPTFEAFDAVAGKPEDNALVDADYTVAKTNSDAADVTEMKDVDVYTFTFTAAADGNYSGTVTADFEITPKPINAEDVEFALTTESVEYDGADHKADVEVNPTAPLTADDYDVILPAEMVNAGEYTVTLKATADGNYSGETTTTFTITQKPLDASFFVLNGENPVIFDGTDQIPGFTLLASEPIVDADFTYATTVKESGDEVSEMIDADTYTYTFTAAAAGNYSGEVTVDFVINQATATIVEPTLINLTYNGYDQILVNEGTSDAVEGTEGQAGALVEYQVTAGNEVVVAWTDDYYAVVGKNAGDYEVKYRITASEKNYTNPKVEGDVTVTINKATVGYNLSNLEKTWDGETFTDEEIAKLFTLYAGGEGGKLFGDDEYDKPFTLTLPEDYRDAGTYTFKQPKVEFKEGYPVNYNVNFAGEAEIVINKADITAADFTAPEAIAGVIYNKEAQDIVKKGEVTTDYQYPEMEKAEFIGEMLYATSEDAEDEEWTKDPIKGTEAGGYTVYFMVKGDKNHNDFEATLIDDVKIGEAALTDAFLPDEYETELTYKGAAYEATDFIPALKDITLDEGYQVFAPEMINAGDYTLQYKGINNYTGEFIVNVKIVPASVVATAPKGVTKVYDGTASLENAKIGGKALSNEDITFNGLFSPDVIELPTELAMVTEGIDAGEKYAITVNPDLFKDANPNYVILPETIEGEVEITAAPAVKVGFDAVPSTWTKKFGEKDPALTGYTVKVTGDFYESLDDVLAATKAERAEGEDVAKYDVTLTVDATAKVFKNYEGAEFDGTAAKFEITKSDKTYTVSLANIEETYNGEEFDTAIEITADDLVIAGYEGELADFFTTLPTATLAGGAKTVGDYNITLTAGESQNFNFTFVPATFTIKPFEVKVASVENQKVQKGKELDVTKFTVTAPAADAEKFYVAAPGLVDMDDIVIGDAGVYADGLVLAVDDEVAANYTGLDAFTAELEIISGDAVVLADNVDCKPAADQKGVDVTFASRKINAGNWNVLALPFEATVAQISDAFGYAAVDILKEDNTAEDEVHFTVITSGSVPAYTPFLVKTTDDSDKIVENFDQVVFHNVDIMKGDGENKVVTDAAGNKFIGTFKAQTTFYGKQFRYMSKGAWYNAEKYTESNPVKLAAFRGYLETVSASARIFVEEPDGTVTAIDAINFNNANAEGVYNLNGMKVNNINRKGVYIKNGVKVIK